MRYAPIRRRLALAFSTHETAPIELTSPELDAIFAGIFAGEVALEHTRRSGVPSCSSGMPNRHQSSQGWKRFEPVPSYDAFFLPTIADCPRPVCRRRALPLRKSVNLTRLSWHGPEDEDMALTGCSNGFGKRLAMAAADRGDQVATARTPQAIKGMAAAYDGRMITAPLDVTDPASAASAVAKAVETFGGLDVLVNNAGYGLFGAIEEGTPDEYRPMFEVNVFGLIETTKAALPILRSKGGTIVNFSSGAGIAGGGAVVADITTLRSSRLKACPSPSGRAPAVRHPRDHRQTRPFPYRIPGSVDHHGSQRNARICFELR